MAIALNLIKKKVGLLLSAFRDRTGERYGRLVVIKHMGKDHRGKHIWLCQCDCGQRKIVVGDNLSSGKSKSCGCLLTEFLKKRGNQFGLFEDREYAIFKVQYSHLMRRHKKFNGTIMPIEDFIKKSKSPCYYCGLEYSKVLYDRRNETKADGLFSDTVVKCNGIDRIDSNRGYTITNTVPCCKYCNTAKSTMSKEDFLSWVKRVYKFNFE